MRLSLVIEGMHEASGGPPLEIARLSREFLAAGHEVSILAPKVEGSEVPLDPRVRFLRLPISGTNIAVLANYITEEAKRSDGIIVTGVWGGIVGPAMQLARPWQYTPVYFRTVGMLEPYIMGRNPRKKALALASYVSPNLSETDGVLVSSASEAQNVKKLIPEARIIILPNGVSLDEIVYFDKHSARIALSLDQDSFIILFFGRLHVKKRCLELLNTFSELNTKGKKAELIYAGPTVDSNYHAQLQSVIAEKNLGDRVSFTGNLSGIRKWQMLQAADLFVLPSSSEGFSNAVLESLAIGCPAIITRGCNFDEVGTEGGGIVLDNSLEGLRSSIELYLNDGDALKTAGAAGKALIESKYSWRYLANKHISLFSSEPKALVI